MAGLTPWDTLFVVLAVVQVISIGVMAYVASLLMQTARKGQRRVQPVLREARGLQQIGQAMATQSVEQVSGMAARVKAVVKLVRRRARTTRRIAREVLPPVHQAAADARAVQGDLTRKAVSLGVLARRLGKVKAAAEAAAAAGRTVEPKEPARVG